MVEQKRILDEEISTLFMFRACNPPPPYGETSAVQARKVEERIFREEVEPLIYRAPPPGTVSPLVVTQSLKRQSEIERVFDSPLTYTPPPFFVEMQLIIEHEVRVIVFDENLQQIAPPLSPEVSILKKVQ